MSPGSRIAITGAASGLGKALALHFGAKGWKLALADIHTERGQQTLAELNSLGVDAFYTHCDVRRIEDLQAWRQLIVARWGGLDVLVNNAGVAAHGKIDQAPLEDWQWIIDINLLGVVRGCKIFVPLFKQQGSGHLVNIASMAGLIHAPEMASYNASKAGVVALSETLHAELVSDKIAVSVVCPGFFLTHLGESMRSPSAHSQRTLAKLFAQSKVSADDVARLVFQGVQARKFMITSHWKYNVLWYLKRLVPRLYQGVMNKGAQKIVNQ